MKRYKRNDTSAKARSKGERIAKKQNRQAKEGVSNGIPFESGCELAVLNWLFELKKSGVVHSIERCPSFLLSDGVVNNYTVNLKNSASKVLSQVILRPHSYTADYLVIFNRNAIGKFIFLQDNNMKYDKSLLVGHLREDKRINCYIEVKPDFSFKGKTEKAINDGKWVYAKYGVFINIFKPNERFELTFTPETYKVTERGKQRLLRFTPRSLTQYLKL